MAAYSEKSTLSLCFDILKDPESKSLFRIIYEVLYLLIVQRELPVHYFSRYLFKKTATNIKDYIPNRFLGYKITPNFNDSKLKEILDNKLFFDLYYRQFNLPVPEILIYNFGNMFVVDGKTIRLHKPVELMDVMEDVFKKNKDTESVIIKRTVAGSCGNNIFKINRDKVRTDGALINKIYSEVICSGYLFQKTVKQHPDLDKLNPSCLNTIRIDTYIDKKGNSEVISAYLRMSIANQFIDNISSGGCQVGIDLYTGKLKKYGYAPVKLLGTKVLEEHPVTKIRFENFEIPFFDKVKELALATSSKMPSLRLVGWDIAVGESGTVLIEGNSDYDISGNDLAYEGYFKNPVFREVLRELYHLKREE